MSTATSVPDQPITMASSLGSIKSHGRVFKTKACTSLSLVHKIKLFTSTNFQSFEYLSRSHCFQLYFKMRDLLHKAGANGSLGLLHSIRTQVWVFTTHKSQISRPGPDCDWRYLERRDKRTLGALFRSPVLLNWAYVHWVNRVRQKSTEEATT